MSEGLRLILCGVAGVALGAFFFGGLWWTITYSLRARWAALWLLGSLCLRCAFVLSGFYLIAQGQWQRWVACLCGFVAVRIAVGYLSAAAPLSATSPGKASHASQS